MYEQRQAVSWGVQRQHTLLSLQHAKEPLLCSSACLTEKSLNNMVCSGYVVPCRHRQAALHSNSTQVHSSHTQYKPRLWC